MSVASKRALLLAQSELREVRVPRSVLAETPDTPHEKGVAREGTPLDIALNLAPNQHVQAPSIGYEDSYQKGALLDARELSTLNSLDDTTQNSSDSDPITSGYWISAGSMVERRVALLDRQSEQLQRHVKSVMASAESLASRADLVLQSLQLVNEAQPAGGRHSRSLEIQMKVESLQALSMNLALKAPTVELSDPLLDQLEEFNDELASLSSEIRSMGNTEIDDSAYLRRLHASIDEGRRLSAAADSLRERTETLYEDAQRFRRHSEALIRGIQEGAISDISTSALKASLISS